MLPQIKLRRLAIGLTRAEFAARAKLTPERIAVLEEEHDLPTDAEVVDLAQALRVSVAELLSERAVTVAVSPVRVAPAPRSARKASR